jgi:hypothetical protein
MIVESELPGSIQVDESQPLRLPFACPAVFNLEGTQGGPV